MDELLKYFKMKDKTGVYNWDSLEITKKIETVSKMKKSKYDSYVIFKSLFDTKRIGFNFYAERGWSSDEINLKIEKTTSKRKLTRELFISRYGNIEGEKKWELFINRSKQTKENFVNRYGLVDGEQKWDEYKRTLSKSQTKEGYIEKYGVCDGISRWEKKNKRQSFSNTKEGYIARYGEKDGNYKWAEQVQKKSHTIDYFIIKYGEIDGINKYNNFLRKSTQSKSNFIRIYGANEGIKRWEKFKEKNAHSNSKEFYIEKYGYEDGISKFNDKIVKMRNGLNSIGVASKMSLNIFNPIAQFLIDHGYFLNDDFFYGIDGSSEFSIGKDLRLYDFVVIPLKLIIEFNGSHVHPSKDKLTESEWLEWKNPFTDQTADEKYEYDQNKIIFARNNGFDVVEVWDYDDVFETIEMLKNIIKGKIDSISRG